VSRFTLLIAFLDEVIEPVHKALLENQLLKWPLLRSVLTVLSDHGEAND
jgi:hypothetical protein